MTPRIGARPVQGGLALPSVDPPLAVAHAAVDPERAAERRVVDEGEWRHGAAELDPAGDRRAKQRRIHPELCPANRREPRGERIVAVVLPRTEHRLERRLPGSDCAADGLREQLQPGVDREPHTL